MSHCSLDAYILHLRPYTDSRLLIDFYTESSGMIRAVGRVPGKRQQGTLQSFQRLHVVYWGDSELKTLRAYEPSGGASLILTGEALYCGMYINELLQRLLQPEDPSPDLFHFYEDAIGKLRQASSRLQLEAVLRQFEFFLLEHLGFAVTFDVCAESGVEIRPNGFYIFETQSGFHEYEAAIFEQGSTRSIPGEHLLALAKNDYANLEVLRSAKRISRQALGYLLGTKPLKTKELFR